MRGSLCLGLALEDRQQRRAETAARGRKAEGATVRLQHDHAPRHPAVDIPARVPLRLSLAEGDGLFHAAARFG